MGSCADPRKLDQNVCPLLAPPAGEAGMDPNAFTLWPYMLATTIVTLSLSIPAVTARIFTRAYLLKSMQIEDYSLILAAAGFVSFAGVMNKTFDWGAGRHQWNVSIADSSRIVQYSNYAQILYSPSMFFAKLTVLLQIQRLFCVNQRNLTFWTIQTLIAANAALYLAVFFAFIFACWPREAIWSYTVTGKCLNRANVMIGTSAINLVSDIIILILPLHGISTLQMPLKRKLGVSAVFAVGLLAVIASILRLVYTIKVFQTFDMSYWVAPVGMGSLAELSTVILCACFPTLPRLLKFLRGKDRQSKYLYGTKSVSRNTPKGSSNGPYSWSEITTGDEHIGSYIPLDERIAFLGESDSEAATNNSRTLPKIDEEHNRQSIQRTAEIGAAHS